MLNKRNHRMLQEIDVKLMKEIIIYALHFILQVWICSRLVGQRLNNNKRKSFLTLTFAFFKLKWIFIICLLTGYFSSWMLITSSKINSMKAHLIQSKSKFRDSRHLVGILSFRRFFTELRKNQSCVLDCIDSKYTEVFKYLRICEVLTNFTSSSRYLEQYLWCSGPINNVQGSSTTGLYRPNGLCKSTEINHWKC